jgi:hypothetical protein
MAKTQGGLGQGSRPYGLGAPAMPAAAPGYGGTPSPVMGTQPGGGMMMPLGVSGGGGQPSTLSFTPPGTPGVTPPGVPPQLAHIWHLLPPQLQQMFGGQSPISGLLGGFGSQAGNPIGGIMGLLQQRQPQHPQQQAPAPMQASSNPYPVPQSYQTPSTPLAGATMGPQGNPYQVPQTY